MCRRLRAPSLATLSAIDVGVCAASSNRSRHAPSRAVASSITRPPIVTSARVDVDQAALRDADGSSVCCTRTPIASTRASTLVSARDSSDSSAMRSARRSTSSETRGTARDASTSALAGARCARSTRIGVAYRQTT
jgi:hypothetical protein